MSSILSNEYIKQSSHTYIGLKPYSEGEADCFWGRKEETEILINRLRAWRLTVLYGESGVGKSSILRAGVAFKLRQQVQQYMEKAQASSGKAVVPNFWIVVFPSLSSECLGEYDNYDKNEKLLNRLLDYIEKELNSIQAAIQLPQRQSSFSNTLKLWAESLGTAQKAGKLFIILDQFEEYLLKYTQGEESSELLINELIDIITSPDISVNFLISIHSDSVIKLDRFNKSADLLSNRLELKPISEEKVKEDILKNFLERYKSKIQEKLPKSQVIDNDSLTLANEIGGKIAALEPEDYSKQKTINLAYLQLVMRYLWEDVWEDRESKIDVLDPATYTHLEVKDIIQKYVDKHLYNKVYKDHQDIAATLFKYLVTSSGTSISYSIKELFLLIQKDFSEQGNKNILDSLKDSLKIVLDNLSCPDSLLLCKVADRYEIYPGLEWAILDWKDRFLAKQERYKAKLVTEIACESIIAALRLRLDQEIKFSEAELTALLALQAYCFNKGDKFQTLNKVDEALRQALNIPYSTALLYDHQIDVAAVAYSPDGQIVASGDYNGIIHLYQNNLSSRKFQSDQGTITSVTFHPKDNHKLAVGHKNRTLEIWDIVPSQPQRLKLIEASLIQDIQTTEEPCYGVGLGSVAFSPDGQWLAFGSWDKTVRLWHYKQDNLFHIDCRLEHQDWVGSLAFNRHGNRLAVGCRDGTVSCWKFEQVWEHEQNLKMSEISNNSELIQIDQRRYEVFSVTFSPVDQKLAAGSYGVVRLWDLDKGLDYPPVNQYGRSEDRAIRALAFSPDGKHLCLGSDDVSEKNDLALRLWDVTKRDALAEILCGSDPHELGVSSVAFRPDGKAIVSGSWDGKVRKWNLEPDRPEPLLLGEHDGRVRAVSFSPDGKWVASGAWEKNNTVRLWNTEWLWDSKNLPQSQCHYLPTSYYGNSLLAFSPDGTFLASGGHQEDKSVRLWDLRQPDADPTVLHGHSGEVRAVAFSWDGQWLISGSWDKTLRLWQLKNLDIPPITLYGFTGAIRTLACSQNKKWLAVGTGVKDQSAANNQSQESTVWLLAWEQIITSKPGDFINAADKSRQLEPALESETFGVAFSPDSELLASVNRDNQLHLWNLSQDPPSYKNPLSGQENLLTRRGFAGSSVAFSPDGKKLAVGCWSDQEIAEKLSGSVWIWNINDLRSPDSRSQPIILAEPELPSEKLRKFSERRERHITSIAFSPDSQFLASGSNDWTIRIWTISSRRLADLVCHRVKRNLTQSEWDDYVGAGIPYEITIPDYAQSDDVQGNAPRSVLKELLSTLEYTPPSLILPKTSQEGKFHEKLAKLDETKQQILELIKHRHFDQQSKQKDTAEEDVSNMLKKNKGDCATYFHLRTLHRMGFLRVSEFGKGVGTIKYCLSWFYEQYLMSLES